MRVFHPQVARGSANDKHAAPAQARYVGMYYWCAYWRVWDKVLAVDPKGQWTVQSVNLEGQPLPGEDGKVRTHFTTMDARHFADRPFEVKSRYESTVLNQARN